MEEQKIRVLVLGSRGSGVTAFIKAVDETGYVSSSPNPDYSPDGKIQMDFGRYSITKSLTLHLFGARDWTIFFHTDDFRSFTASASKLSVLASARATANFRSPIARSSGSPVDRGL